MFLDMGPMSPMKWGLSVLPSFRLSRSFLGTESMIFLKNRDCVRNPYEVVRDRAGFLFLPPKWGKWTENVFFFELIEKPGHFL